MAAKKQVKYDGAVLSDLMYVKQAMERAIVQAKKGHWQRVAEQVDNCHGMLEGTSNMIDTILKERDSK